MNGVILDTLRVYARPRETSLPEPGEAGEPYVEDSSKSSEVWEVLQTLLPDRREKRLAYLLFHCGLSPREIVRFCPQEWSDVDEIYRSQRNMLDVYGQLTWSYTSSMLCPSVHEDIVSE